MADKKHLARLKQGVESWNSWRKGNFGVHLDVSGADLTKLDLREGNFMFVNFAGANLRESALCDAFLLGANLTEVNLTGADLTGADLSAARLNGADLRNSNLSGADFTTAHLVNSNLRAAIMQSTLFGDTDLRQAIGLENIVHKSASIIGTHTFSRSKGKLPDVFLRGCGLSDWEIEAVKLYKPDLSNEERNQVLYRIYDLQARQAIQVSPLFISYSHADSEVIDKVEGRLNAKGVRYWRDTHDMKAGKIEKQINRAIRQNPTVLLVLSEHSIESDWVGHEVRTARQLEKDMRRDVLCPIALDDSWKSSRWSKRLMEQIMEYNILDFSEWRDDGKFDSMFRRLIDGLELFYKG